MTALGSAKLTALGLRPGEVARLIPADGRVRPDDLVPVVRCVRVIPPEDRSGTRDGGREGEEGIAVTLCDGSTRTGTIAKALVDAGIAVLAIVPETLRLDQAFLQLTQGIVH